MRMSFRISLLTATLAFALALPSLAQAQMPRDVLRDFGMLGTWATDCSRPAGEDGYRPRYRLHVSSVTTPPRS